MSRFSTCVCVKSNAFSQWRLLYWKMDFSRNRRNLWFCFEKCVDLDRGECLYCPALSLPWFCSFVFPFSLHHSLLPLRLSYPRLRCGCVPFPPPCFGQPRAFDCSVQGVQENALQRGNLNALICPLPLPLPVPVPVPVLPAWMQVNLLILFLHPSPFPPLPLSSSSFRRSYFRPCSLSHPSPLNLLCIHSRI